MQAKSPLNIQPFVKKCFEAVKCLNFEQNGDITGMESVEGEAVQFVDAINPAAVGPVEKWLLKVEGVMKRTLHKIAGDALSAYATTERRSWILDWPGQLVLGASQVYWTSDVTAAIKSGGAKGLAQYGAKCTDELNKIVGLVRGPLTKLQRATCGSLVVIDVHARDVTVQMASDGVHDVRDFKWESQLRYEWEFNEAPPSGAAPSETLVVRMINAQALYGCDSWWLGAALLSLPSPLTAASAGMNTSATRGGWSLRRSRTAATARSWARFT